jgi:alpha-galactosidase
MSGSAGKKIVFIGGGSTQFTPALMVDFIHAKGVYGSEIVLVDIDEEKLGITTALSKKLMEVGGADYTINSTTDRKNALAGADFVVISVEIKRFPLWDEDRRIPAELGIKQAMGENGGPGGLMHSMRQIPPIVEICQDVEKICPDALVMNLANPMSRISLAVNDHTNVKYIGLCHEIGDGNKYLSSLLDMPESRLHVVAAGLNHFTWYLKIQDKETGADLYPKVREQVPNDIHRDRLMVADLMRLTGTLCVTSDGHVGEYLSDGHIWSTEYDAELEPFDFFDFYRNVYIPGIDMQVQALIAGDYPAEDYIKTPSGEIVADMIETIVENREKRYEAFNLPNDGYITNLPDDCIVEVPAVLNGSDFGGEIVGDLPPLIAGWCRAQADIQKLVVKAAMNGDRQSALEALLLDPVVPNRYTAEKCLDQMLHANREYLPRFYS